METKEALRLYQEHCTDERLQALPQNVIMKEVAKRVWRGQMRQPDGTMPTVYVFTRPAGEEIAGRPALAAAA